MILLICVSIKVKILFLFMNMLTPRSTVPDLQFLFAIKSVGLIYKWLTCLKNIR